MNIATGLVASDEVRNSLLQFHSEGQKNLPKFLTRLSQEPATRKESFYAAIKKCNIKTFSHMYKKTTVRIAGGAPSEKVVSPEVLLQRALAVQASRKDLRIVENVLKYPCTNVPPAIFKPDGTMRSTSKSDLLHLLERWYEDMKI